MNDPSHVGVAEFNTTLDAKRRAHYGFLQGDICGRHRRFARPCRLRENAGGPLSGLVVPAGYATPAAPKVAAEPGPDRLGLLDCTAVRLPLLRLTRETNRGWAERRGRN